MKRLLTAVCALAILAPGLAVAQDGPRNPDNRNLNDVGPGRGGRNGVAGRERPASPPPRQQARPQAQAPAAPAPQARPDRNSRGERGGENRGPQNRGPENRGPDNRGQFNRGPENRGPDNRGPDNRGQFNRGPDNRGPDNRGQFNRGPGDNDRRFDNNRPGDRRFDNRPGDRRGFEDGRRFDGNRGERFRYGNRDFYRFRAQPYVWPRGFASRSWRQRDILPRFFFEDQYYIDNFFDLGLPPPPYGYRWLRVGDDALLVDLRTGLIADVIPGVFFW